jgi:hypothetical protein
MKVLIACEFSGIVREAFRRRGHDAWSCDLLDTEIPGQHIKGDVLAILNDGWDLMIAHPPCTYLSGVGWQWFNVEKYGDKAMARIENRKEAYSFFVGLYNSPINKICIENPVGYMNSHFRKGDQIIQPWQFGNEARKRTCLWLKNLPLLSPTKIVGHGEIVVYKGKEHAKWFMDAWHLSPIERMKARSRTFPGIAEAMAMQWG